MPEYRSLIPPREQICQRLNEVVREEKRLRELLKLSVREEQDRQQAQDRNRDGGQCRG
jgi:hypothetical protein